MREKVELINSSLRPKSPAFSSWCGPGIHMGFSALQHFLALTVNVCSFQTVPHTPYPQFQLLVVNWGPKTLNGKFQK
jgi:hypothetical protein